MAHSNENDGLAYATAASGQTEQGAGEVQKDNPNSRLKPGDSYSSNFANFFNEVSEQKSKYVDLWIEYSDNPELRQYFKSITDPKSGDFVGLEVIKEKVEDYKKKKNELGL